MFKVKLHKCCFDDNLFPLLITKYYILFKFNSRVNRTEAVASFVITKYSLKVFFF